MNIAILHDRITGDSRPDEVDALAQARLVEEALRDRGHRVFTLGVDLDLASLEETLRRRRPDLVFNLVESLGGHGRLIHLVPALLEALRVPFTGCGATAMFLTSKKLLAKELLHRSGIPTPPWWAHSQREASPLLPCTFVIKPVWEDASVGIDDDAVVHVACVPDLERLMEERAQCVGGEVFAEAFVEGREFNLSLLAGPEVLPPAEIDFVGYPPGKPRIVGYAAKWDATSFEFSATQRRFDFSDSEDALVERLSTLARACWDRFDVSGYARVDFRVDTAGRPWVLEVNANPCLSPDAGFMAACDRAGYGVVEVIERIIADAMNRAPQTVLTDHA